MPSILIYLTALGMQKSCHWISLGRASLRSAKRQDNLFAVERFLSGFEQMKEI